MIHVALRISARLVGAEVGQLSQLPSEEGDFGYRGNLTALCYSKPDAQFNLVAPLSLPQIGWSIDLASCVKSFGPASVMNQQSSSRIPNSPGM